MKKINNTNKNKNKKQLIVISIIVAIIIAIVVTVVVVIKLNNKEINNGVNTGNQELNVSGKLAEYIRSLTNNYYIKYSGNFKNSSNETVNAIVEYTKDGENFALRASELDIHLICEGDTLYSISHAYKMIVEMNKHSIDIAKYNLASDMGQAFIKSYKESRNNTEYDVEEYMHNGNTIKYYFKGNDLKHIRYNLQDISVLRVEKNVNTELFSKPTGYSNV